MADDDAAENAEDTEEEGTGKSKKKLIIIIVGVLLLIVISIGGTLFAVKMLTPEPEPEVVLDEDGNPILTAEEEEAAAAAKMPAIYFPLKPPIIVNFQARGRQRFLQAEVTLMSREDDVIEAVELHMPMIRNSLVLLFGGQVYAELQTEEGKELLRQQALTALQEIMQKEVGKPGVEKLLFTNFVMQ